MLRQCFVCDRGFSRTFAVAVLFSMTGVSLLLATILLNESASSIAGHMQHAALHVIGADHVPFFIECTAKCVQIRHRNCLGDVQPLRGYDRYAHRWQPSSRTETTTTTTVAGSSVHNNNHNDQSDQHIHGTVVYLQLVHDAATNINHAFHDALWGLLAYGASRANQATTAPLSVVYDEGNCHKLPWVCSLLQAAADVYSWTLLEMSALKTRKEEQEGGGGGDTDDAWLCASEHVYLTGFIRDLHRYRFADLGSVRHALRRHVLRDNQTVAVHRNATRTYDDDDDDDDNKQDGDWQETILIYTREHDSNWRQLVHVAPVLALLDETRFRVRVVHSLSDIPFQEQASLFASAALVIAPNGGWAPNILFLPKHACVVELHQYVTDSWLEMFGLGSLLQSQSSSSQRLLLVTGDYRQDRTVHISPRKGRAGGDDPLHGSRVAPDIHSALSNSEPCRRFLLSSLP